ncbi:MAG: dihydropteroate synthase [Verrucomicrobiales bacterium]|jgi:dihydropteroate synthase
MRQGSSKIRRKVMVTETDAGTNDRWRWQVGARSIDLKSRGLIMGILNVTPDSFSDGGQFSQMESAQLHAQAMIAAGADIIDIGGESTRPGAQPVSEKHELERVLPVITATAAFRRDSNVMISIDTSKARVAEEALAAGADIINDVTGLRGDPHMLDVAAASDAGLVIMHMKGQPRTMQAAPHYQDVIDEVATFFRERESAAAAAGIDRARILFDPGIGFGKALEHNLQLLQRLDCIAPAQRPLLLGVSRKSFIGKVLGTPEMADRYWATVALTSFAREKGARVFRVHDVEGNVQALQMTEAILNASPSQSKRSRSVSG